MLNAKSRIVSVGGSDMDYVSFGSGEHPLVMLPGLGEALQSVKGTALAMAMAYKVFAKDYTVYVFGRKRQLAGEYSISDMAEDQAKAMHSLGIMDACVMGISQGGMIAMELSAAHPELVAKLVLANTAAQCTQTMQCVIGKWVQLVKADKYKELLNDMGERVYTEKKLKLYKPWYPIMAVVGKPNSFRRFIIQANACLTHNASDKLKKIKCPTLVIGGDADHVVGSESALEIAKQIDACQLLICEGYGHSAHEEYPNINKLVLDFFNEKS